jgi:hypothetical protein
LANRIGSRVAPEKRAGVMARNVKRGSDLEPSGANRFHESFTLAWKELEPRVGNREVVRQTLARLIVSIGRRKPGLSASELKALVVKMLNAPHAQIAEAPPNPKRGPGK